MRMQVLVCFFVMFFAAVLSTQAQTSEAPTPPMGWNSWNKFACNVNEQVVRDTADAMVSSGMRDAGYQYVVIDDCWHAPRDVNGFITADAQKFPSGIKALADYVHSRGLKFGIYSDAGRLTCGGRPGSQGHEYQDALAYARWGVDYLKVLFNSFFTNNGRGAFSFQNTFTGNAVADMLLGAIWLRSLRGLGLDEVNGESLYSSVLQLLRP